MTRGNNIDAAARSVGQEYSNPIHTPFHTPRHTHSRSTVSKIRFLTVFDSIIRDRPADTVYYRAASLRLKRDKNKAGYTVTPGACGWAGAVEKVTREYGGEQ